MAVREKPTINRRAALSFASALSLSLERSLFRLCVCRQALSLAYSFYLSDTCHGSWVFPVSVAPPLETDGLALSQPLAALSPSLARSILLPLTICPVKTWQPGLAPFPLPLLLLSYHTTVANKRGDYNKVWSKKNKLNKKKPQAMSMDPDRYASYAPIATTAPRATVRAALFCPKSHCRTKSI